MSRNKDLNPRNGDFDLTELMNKFLAEYDSGNGNEYEPHQEEVSFDPEPQYNQEHHPYHHQQPHHQQQQYYEDHHHQQQQQQFYQDKPQQPIYQGYPKEPQRNQVYNRYKDESNKVNNANQDKQKSVAQPSNSAKQSQESSTPAKQQNDASQEEEVDPKLRDFTLIISKLLFQLSQL